MPSIDLYTKQQIDAKIPDTSGASAGDVLTFNGTNTVWSAGGGGGSTTPTAITDENALITAITNGSIGMKLIGEEIYVKSTYNDYKYRLTAINMVMVSKSGSGSSLVADFIGSATLMIDKDTGTYVNVQFVKMTYNVANKFVYTYYDGNTSMTGGSNGTSTTLTNVYTA